MTGNQIKGRGFRGALRYNLDKVARNVAEVLDSSFARSTEEGIMKEVRMIRSLRPRLEKYFYHTSINFPPGENPNNELMKKIGNEYLQKSGFHANQYIMFRHHDAGHPHLHILVNRIGYDGSLVSDSNDFQRSENVLRELERKYHLTQVLPSRAASRRALSKDEIEKNKRTGLSGHKERLQSAVRFVLKSKHLDVASFLSQLESKGVRVLFNQASTGHVSGVTYELEGFRITGARLGNEFKWTSIRSRIGFGADNDKDVIKKNNAAVAGKGNSSFAPVTNTQHLVDTQKIEIEVPDFVISLIKPETTPLGAARFAPRKKRRKKKRRL